MLDDEAAGSISLVAGRRRTNAVVFSGVVDRTTAITTTPQNDGCFIIYCIVLSVFASIAGSAIDAGCLQGGNDDQTRPTSRANCDRILG
jgi:hypothetical protein